MPLFQRTRRDPQHKVHGPHQPSHHIRAAGAKATASLALAMAHACGIRAHNHLHQQRYRLAGHQRDGRGRLTFRLGDGVYDCAVGTVLGPRALIVPFLSSWPEAMASRKRLREE